MMGKKTMFNTLFTETKQKLWKHQANALDFAIDHLNKWDSPCLIRMPTGTGKTGVIACLTRFSNQGSSLVLTPWAHLRNQMVADLERNFWKKIDLIPKKLRVVSMFPSTAKEILEFKEPQVIIATFATLNDLRNNQIDLYSTLAETISLVIVDEGHYEPAVEWGKSVKNLNTKTLLLTATPYRNDIKLFRITDPERSTNHFTHKEAVEKGIIRKLKFMELESSIDIRSLSKAFINKWDELIKTDSLPSPTPRAIICCSSASDIEEVVILLRKSGLNTIGIHEQFKKSSNPSLLEEVPNPESTDSEIWVHQHKLTEGLDDSRFCCIALFTPITIEN
jgi:superfamily II DNA or RNA helicase